MEILKEHGFDALWTPTVLLVDAEGAERKKKGSPRAIANLWEKTSLSGEGSSGNGDAK